MCRGIRGRKLMVALILATVLVRAQPPEATLRVVVTDATGAPLVNAEVGAQLVDRGIDSVQRTGSDGACFFASLPPGVYTLRIALPGYVALLRQGITLNVAAREQIGLVLEREQMSSGEAERNVGTFLQGTPSPPILVADTVASSLSVVMDESKILQLPLLNRNVYSLFLLQPGVTSQEASGIRGLRFSVHGQRVSGSNYLLDGVDNNNTTLTGPVTVTSLEGIQEFRMTNSSFSAEAGRATSFVAQVITRPGTNSWHERLFGYFGNKALDANTFSNNANSLPKSAVHQLQTGLSVGGPVRHDKTYAFASVELSRFRFTTSQDVTVPTREFIESLPAGSPFAPLFASTPPIPVPPSAADPSYGTATVQVPNRLDTLFVTGRLDHIMGAGRDRLIARYTLSGTEERLSDAGSQEFQGYPNLWPTDELNGQNSMAGWTHIFQGGPVNDFRVGWNRYRINFPRPFDDRPLLRVPFPFIDIASSPRTGAQNENNNIVQFADNFTLRRGRSSITAGFESRYSLNNGVNQGIESSVFGGQGVIAAGLYQFQDMASVARNEPLVFGIAVDRYAFPFKRPDFNRRYRSTDYAAYIQDDLKLTRGLSINIGLRWEHFGVMHNTDRTKDVNLYFGAGSTPAERIANGILRPTTENPGDLKGLLYRPAWRNFAPSIGLAWDPFHRGQTVVRAGYALAYDRIYDTVRDVRTSSSPTLACFPPECSTVLLPVERNLSLFQPVLKPSPVAIVDENLKTPYAQNWYFGIQQNLAPNLLIELAHAGSAGRKLLSRDQVNRLEFGPSLAGTIEDNFISNQGNSNYLNLEASLIGRAWHGLQYQLSYTWGHAIDNQSDLLEGVRIGPDRADVAIATFTRMLDPRFDRASANFDQRHNLVVNAIWDLPAPRSSWKMLLGGWSVSGIAAARSGFPVTVIYQPDREHTFGLRNNRPDLVGNPSSFSQYSVPGGRQWLSSIDFGVPAGPGSLGRNALPGPGSWNTDLALLRNFSIREGNLRLQLRGEFYNAFNHANLSPPVSDLSQSDFGVSYAGQAQSYSRFGELPLDSAARRIQLALRLTF
jgi:TonB dependent receptor/Carboxypeptidase regulatory-like domain